ncbi:hypothetical protein KFE25_009542 [Diacronema lutheri]|uniref:Uncharacterized protein n=1 Tax=Diacronema lutheri TaxID=2081491 RepID=A0A8J5XY09_DIALT|nr:hypothetical protein KFE25_009542 [Diacronema lutheri]
MFSRVGLNLPKGGATEHSATAFNHGPVPKVVVFGGWNGAYHTNELAVLSTDAPGAATSDGWGWEPLTVIGRGPSPRSGHTATPLDEDGSSVLFFGGEYTTVGRKYYATTDVLETATLTWRPLETVGAEPRARAHHAAAYVGDGRVVVFGGSSSYGGGFFLDDLHELDCARAEWHAWAPAGDEAFVPAPRMGHTLTHSRELGGALLFGGEDGETSYNDVALFETGVRAWRPLRLSGMAPVPRAGHSATLVSPSRLYVFGGRARTRSDAGSRARARGAEFRYLQDVGILDLTTLSFSSPALSSRLVPAPRAFHTATSLLGADGVPFVLVLGGRGDGRLPHADGFILDVALLAGVQDYADGYALLATQLQSARIDAAKAIDARDAAEQAANEAVEDSAASARDADAAADELAAARAQVRAEASRTEEERARVDALAGSLRDAQAALAEQRAALAQATDTAARLADDRAADARAAQRELMEARSAADAAAAGAALELRAAQADAAALKAQLARASADNAQRDTEEAARVGHLVARADGADARVAAAERIAAEAKGEAEKARVEAEHARQRAAAAGEVMAHEHARELAAASAREAATQARAEAAAAGAADKAREAAEALRRAEVDATSLRAQLSHALAIEQATQLRLRETQATRAAEAAELRQGLASAAADADEARAAFRAARAEGRDSLSQLSRELDAAHVRTAELEDSRSALVAGWEREREALVARIQELAADATARELAGETRAAELDAARAELSKAASGADTARAATATAELALASARTDMAVAMRSLARELSALESTVDYAARANDSLARTTAEAEARAAAVDSAMRGRLQEVTRALSNEAKLTADLLSERMANATAGRLTMRPGSDGANARQNVDSEGVAVSPGVAAPRPPGFANAFADH